MRTTHARRSAPRRTSRSALTTAVVSAVVAVAAGGLAGCAAVQPAGGAEPSGTTAPSTTGQGTTEAVPTDQPGVACVDWVFFETPAEAASDAGAVLRGTVVEQDGTAQMYGVESNRWLVDVEEVLERPDPPAGRPQTQPELDVSPGDRIAVVSTPETCSEEAYPGGDPLDPASGLGGPDGSVIILLSAASGDGSGDGSGQEGDVGFHLITPYQGVLTPAKDGALPSKWPAS